MHNLIYTRNMYNSNWAELTDKPDYFVTDNNNMVKKIHSSVRKEPLKVLAQTSSGAYLDVLIDHPAENQNLTIVQQPACKFQILQMTQQSFQNLKKATMNFSKQYTSESSPLSAGLKFLNPGS